MNANLSMIVGRLSIDPILKSYPKADGTKGTRCFFRVATTRQSDLGRPRDERRTSYIQVVTWGEAAKRHAEYLEKGTMVTVIGEWIQETERDSEGKITREHNYLQANNIQYGPKSRKNQPESDYESRIAALEARLAGASAGESSQPAPEEGDAAPEMDAPVEGDEPAAEAPAKKAGANPFK